MILGRRVLFEEQLDAADDRLQRVVDLVSHAGDELANRRQTFAVDQLIAQPELLGDVAFDANEVCHRPRFIAERHDRARHRQAAAVTPLVAQVAAPDALLAHLAADVVPQLLRTPMVEQRGEVHPHQLGTGIAERAQTRVIGVLERAVASRDQDQVAGLLGRRGQQLHTRVGALKLAALDGEPQRQQAHAADDRHRRQQHAERIARIAERLNLEQSVSDQRHGQHRHDREQYRRRLHRSLERDFFQGR